MLNNKCYDWPRRMQKMLYLFVSAVIFSIALQSNLFAGEEPKYPETPQGVVEAFIKADYDGSANEVIGDIEKRMQYTSELYPAGTDCLSVVRSYAIGKVKETATDVTVEVLYNVLGELCGFDSYEAAPQREVIVFGLIKVENRWKIYYPEAPPYISPLTALKIVKYKLSQPYFKHNKDSETKAYKSRIEGTKAKLIRIQEK